MQKSLFKGVSKIEQQMASDSFMSEEEIEEEFDRSKGNVELFFENISERVSKFYMSISSHVLEMMHSKHLSQNETKIHFSEKVLVMSLKTLEVIGRKTNYHYPEDVFRLFSKTQSRLISYLKMKYPRGGPTFVPGELPKKFQSFSMVESPENDILRNMGICFAEGSEKDIALKLKQMFNRIIDELNQKFQVFHSLLQDKAFQTHSKKTLNYKIGRKLPETIAKFDTEDE